MHTSSNPPRNPKFREETRRIFSAAGFTHAMDFQLQEVEHGICAIRMPVGQPHLQQHGLIHGGVLAALADEAAGLAATTVIAAEQLVLTVELKVNFLRPAASSPVICRGEVIRAGRQLIFTEARTYQEEDNRLLLTGHLTMAVQNKPDG
jgi:uncharacterized protein (TIGR00369 family)